MIELKINHSWDVSCSKARLIQESLRGCVVLRDGFANIEYVAGVDVGFECNNTVTRAAVVVLSYSTLEVVERVLFKCPTTFPYVPGLLSFREIPAVLGAIQKLSIIPDILLCDGQGIAHPKRLGIAAHLGILLDIPTIGVAKSRLIGTYDDVPETKGSYVPLMDHDECIGVVLRSRDNVKPLFVSPGHKMSIESAREIVMNCLTRYRLPETTRQAHHLASECKGMKEPEL